MEAPTFSSHSAARDVNLFFNRLTWVHEVMRLGREALAGLTQEMEQKQLPELTVDDFVPIENGPQTIGQWRLAQQAEASLITKRKVIEIWTAAREQFFGHTAFDIRQQLDKISRNLVGQSLSIAATYNLIESMPAPRQLKSQEELDALKLEQLQQGQFLTRLLFTRCVLCYKRPEIHVDLEATLFSFVIEQFLPDENETELKLIQEKVSEHIKKLMNGSMKPLQAEIQILALIARRLALSSRYCLPANFARMGVFLRLVNQQILEKNPARLFEIYTGIDFSGIDPSLQEKINQLYYEKMQLIHACDINVLRYITALREEFSHKGLLCFDRALIRRLKEAAALCAQEAAFIGYFQRMQMPFNWSCAPGEQEAWWYDYLGKKDSQLKVCQTMDKIVNVFTLKQRNLLSWKLMALREIRTVLGKDIVSVASQLNDPGTDWKKLQNIEEGREALTEDLTAKLLAFYRLDPKFLEV